VPDKLTTHPAICLNMIVRNEAHVVTELLDSVAPYVSSWVIVDTGSDDGTQDLIRTHMTRLGIPGELHERPWRDFGHNRTEALTLAQGHGDYIMVLDADDTLVGTPDFSQLGADIYGMRFRVTPQGGGPQMIWRRQLFRDGVRVRYEGVMHEKIACDEPHVVELLKGEYHIEYRHLGARSRDPQTHARDRDLLLAAVERNPEDAQAVLHLAQTYYLMGDFASARKWYERRAAMGGSEEIVYHAMYQVASSMSSGGAPWPDVQDALLRAWESRPIRAEALYAIAARYRAEQRYRLAYQFARLAAEIPFPEGELQFIDPDVYAFRAAEELAVCASMIGKYREAFTVFRRLVDRPGIPDDQRQRIAGNRDVCAPAMLEAASSYPDAVVRRLVAGRGGTEVVVSLVPGPDRASTERTLNSFLHCCTDVSRIGRFVMVDAGLSLPDRTMLRDRYGFLEFAACGTELGHIRSQIDARFWLHLGQSWRFFAPEKLITRLTAVFDAEPKVAQVGINFADAHKLTGVCAPEQMVRRAPDAGRYVIANEIACGPAMFDTARLNQAGGIPDTDAEVIADLTPRMAAAGLCTATLDEVLCIAAIQPHAPEDPTNLRARL
jgi:hypothetical protein